MANSFELKYSGHVDNMIPVFKYRSKDTGLTVVVAQVGGPLVNGYFCLATEAHDDDGLPHTLEHLVFMGSEKYPYKGVLDLLANRCLASGTNAWTDTDHTCYTMTTAGSEGFLNLMPIYLDHVLYPTLTEPAYVTEVHHVNGEGEDAGVVYCEMQACENTGENRTRLDLLREMYPGHCGYKSETGGAMANLRTSTSHKKVCDYHREFYRPENLCLIITGQVEPQDVCERLQEFEKKIVSKGKLPSHVRPWQSPVPPLPAAVTKTVKYPSDEEENGMVLVAWRGPKAKDQYNQNALMILCEYLTDTAIAPLQRDFVEIEDPYCNDITYSILENSDGCVQLKFRNTPVKKLHLIKDKLFAALKKLGSGEEAIDMERMKVVVKKREQDALSALEDGPHDTIAFYVIGDFLYGDDNEDLDTRLNLVKQYRKLEVENQDFWRNLLSTYMLSEKYVAIIGEPSKALMEEMGSEEKARVAKQREDLGEEGLKKKEEELDEATSDNEEEPPEEMLTCVDVPDVGCIQFHEISPSSNHDPKTANENKLFPLADIPVIFQLDDLQSKFVDLTVLLETSSLSTELQMFLPLYVEAITESPIMRNGQLVGHEQVINELEADTVSYSCTVSIGGYRFKPAQFATVVSLEFKVVQDKYEKGVNWLRELLYQVQFKPDRLKIIAAKMVNDVATIKRRGRNVVSCAMNDMLYKKGHITRNSNMLRQYRFLTDLMKKLDQPDTASAIIDQLNQLRHVITNPAHLRVHMSAHAPTLTEKVKDPTRVWREEFLPEGVTQQGEKSISLPGSAYLATPNSGDEPRAVILGNGAVESSFLVQTTPCISDFNHPDLPAVMVYLQYLTMLEGPMWRQIRGLGLSYHYSMYVKPEVGQLYFILFKSTHLVNAYKQGKQILEDLLSGKEEWNEVELESSKSSLIFEVIEEEKTPSDASHESMMSYLRGVAKDYNRILLPAGLVSPRDVFRKKQIISQIPKVTIDDLKRVGPQYIAPVFDIRKAKTAIVCHPTKVEEVCKEMKDQFSQELTVIENMDESFLAEM